MDYQDRIVMISGGSSGIGLASAKALAAMGAHVFVFSLDEPKQIEDALVQLGQVKAHETQRFGGIRLDVTDQDAVAKELDKACREAGAPDVLINSAGIGGALPFEQISYERFDATVKVNLYGVRNVCAACLPHMRKAGRGGRIVNIASMAGLISVYGYTAYSAAKSAVVGFSWARATTRRDSGCGVPGCASGSSPITSSIHATLSRSVAWGGGVTWATITSKTSDSRAASAPVGGRRGARPSCSS